MKGFNGREVILKDDHVCKSCNWTGDPVYERCPKCGSYDVQEIGAFIEEFNKIDN